MIMTKEEEDRKAKKKSAPKPKKAEAKEAPKAEAKAEAHVPKAEEAHVPKAHEPKAEAKAEPPKAPEPPKLAEAPAKKEHKAKKKAAHKKEARKVIVARGKRKQSIARATISAGKGIVRLNSMNISSINNHYIREIITEPLRYVGPEANNVDISVTANGGGVMGQAQAARTAIANALSKFFDGMNLREKFASIDRSLVIEDIRRVETKKFRGPKARARFQKSYR
jgi:small subunit ribosomal protein S9